MRRKKKLTHQQKLQKRQKKQERRERKLLAQLEVEEQSEIELRVRFYDIDFSKNDEQLSEYQISISSELNANVQTFTNAITKNRAAFDTSMQKYTSEIQKVSSSNATILQKFSAETSNFSAQMQKEGMDYQWYQSQYAQLKADYNQGLQQLISGGISAQGQQGA